MNRNNIEIHDTPLGFGVFSRTDYDAREIVGEVKGKICNDDYESDYCMDLGDDVKLEPRAPFRFLNHSCEPNCELVLWKARWKKGHCYSRLWVQTTCAVGPGEELTIDYAWSAEFAIPCRCHSRKCRGWIVHPDDVDQLRGDLSVEI